MKKLTLLISLSLCLTGFAQKNNPYNNYEGITDLGLAKQEWIKDNPNAYSNYLLSTFSRNPVTSQKTLVAPSNDLIANAIAINCGDAVFGSTEFATNTDNPGTTCGAGASPGKGVWYTFIGTGGEVQFNTCNVNTDYDSQIHLYTGTPGALVCFNADDDGNTPPVTCSITFLSDLIVNTTLGTTYYVYINGFSSRVGNFELNVTCAGVQPCTPININFSASGLKPFWAPATDPYTFYYGLVDAKRINANVSGGVGPYTYTWSNSGAPALLPRSYYPANSIDLFRPLAATTVSVDVFDAGTGCTHTGTVNIGWDGQYHCSAPNQPWNVLVCIGGQTSCVTWATAKAMLKANPPTATLGACDPLKADPETQVASLSVYPNPSSGLFALEMPIAANSKGSVEVMDVNGRALYSESLDMQEGVLYHTLDLGTLPNGIYIVRVATDNEFATERIQIIR